MIKTLLSWKHLGYQPPRMHEISIGREKLGGRWKRSYKEVRRKNITRCNFGTEVRVMTANKQTSNNLFTAAEPLTCMWRWGTINKYYVHFFPRLCKNMHPYLSVMTTWKNIHCIGVFKDNLAIWCLRITRSCPIWMQQQSVVFLQHLAHIKHHLNDIWRTKQEQGWREKLVMSK